MEQAVTIYSESELLLFVQLKLKPLLPADSHLSSLSSSSHTLPLLAAELLPQASKTYSRRKHIISTENSDDDGGGGGGCDEDDTAYLTAKEAACNKMKTLLKQWLPIHSQPDDVEIIDYMPFTKHGKYLLSCAYVSSVIICPLSMSVISFTIVY